MPAAPAAPPVATPATPTPATPPAAPAAPEKGTPLPKVAGPPTVTPSRSNSPAMVKARQDLRNKVDIEKDEEPATPVVTPPATPATPPSTPTTPAKPDEKPLGTPQETPKPTTPEPAKGTDETPPPGDDKDKSRSPWRLVDTLRAKTTALEKELVTLKATSMHTEVQTLSQQLDNVRKRNEELEGEMRFVNFEKSSEYKEKFEKPYAEAWARATADLDELVITGDDGVSRKATPHDLVALAQLPLGEARKMANELFGDAADDVMAHRRIIRDLARAQDIAKEEARKGGDTRQQEAAAASAKLRADTRQLWDQNLAEETERRPHLQTKEGDAEWNTQLEKAQKFVDETLGRHPHDPKLKPEERLDLVRRHVAIRNRAIGFAMRGIEIKRLKADLETTRSELAKFQASTPGVGGGDSNRAVAPATGDPMENAKARLRSLPSAAS